ncbi:uncharacterized protein LOC129771110 isoform X1 [Toxorhynchites rutilus septentrionalis]|uniref:uncharacterized protein LOC129771110 isoform X1 n=1 Tax=Toxorhynchites rutilus septentrionalis TaxID=329112 RepID=UPI002479CC9F|nr:uncharacterized protein LOC129771110 isoform X1 [Toxorhynchites rutilus septentrionalis]
MGLRWAITAKVILTVVTLQLVNAANGYKLNVDTSPEKEMKNMTCESYCGHCGCAGTFFAQENKCVCACDNHDPDFLGKLRETNNQVGLSYAVEIQGSDGRPPNGKHIRVPRQASTRIPWRHRSTPRRLRSRSTTRRRLRRTRSTTTAATTAEPTTTTTTPRPLKLLFVY